MKQIKNGMGHIPYNEDRTVFENRTAYMQMLDILGLEVVKDFEQNYLGNNLSGYSCANILEGIINDYELWCKSSRNYTLDYWFDLSSFSLAYGLDIVKARNSYPYRPDMYNQIINANGTFESLKRTDKKLAPITLVLPYTETKGQLVYNKATVGPSYLKGKIQPETYIDGNGSGTIAILRDFIIHGKAYTPTTMTAKYTHPNNNYNQFIGYINNYTPNTFITSMRDAIAVIRYLESENNAMNIKGNIDGLKVNEYEQILSDQMTYLNNLSDKVTVALIQEKLDGQKLKDKAQENIATAKLNLEAVKKQKRENIALLRQTLAKIK